MKEIKSIIKTYNGLKKNKEKIALVTVIKVEGSSYRRTGARMLIQENGIYTGGISGGCIEGDALRKAFLAIADNKARLVTYDTSLESEAQIGISLGCNGIIHVLISPIDKTDKNNPVEQLLRCSKERANNLLVTVIKKGDNGKIEPGQVIRFESDIKFKEDFTDLEGEVILSDIKEVIFKKKSVLKEYQSYKLFIEFIPPQIKIIIMGGNYDVYPLLKVSNNLSWDSVVVANTNRLNKSITELATSVSSTFDDVAVDEYSVGIIMSHDYNADLINLRKALDSKLAYIGLLGPAKRKAGMLNELSTNQAAQVETRVFGPAGLDIGASQPEEIAISIVSEIISVIRERAGSSLRDRKGPIYNR